MDIKRPQWSNWCRLCAKVDPENNVNMHLPNQPLPTRDEFKLSMELALEKYFCIKTSIELLCGDCHSFLTSLMKFSEHVKRVQNMFTHLMETNDSSDLSSIRLKFNVLDDYVQPGHTQLAMTEVVPISFQVTQESLAKFTIKPETIATDQIVFDEEPLECDAPEDEDDPFETMTDFSAYNPCNSFSEEETKKTKSSNRTRHRRTKKDTNSQIEKNHIDIKSNCNENNQIDAMTDCNAYKGSNSYSEQETEQTKTRSKRIRKRIIKDDIQTGEEKYVDNIDGCNESNQSNTVSEEEEQADKLIRRKRKKQRDIKRKKKDEIRIDYTIDAPCAVCDDKFYLFSTYCEHMLASHVNNQWKCVTCNRELQCRYDFERHLRKHLPKNSIIKHICTICGLELSCSTTLKRHLSVHSDKMQHLCDHCGRAFKRDTTLKAHMILHTGLKPYSCNFCNLTFACKSNCRRHMRKSHSEEFAALQTFGNNAQTKNAC